jgi:hypothetical protein
VGRRIYEIRGGPDSAETLEAATQAFASNWFGAD